MVSRIKRAEEMKRGAKLRGIIFSLLITLPQAA